MCWLDCWVLARYMALVGYITKIIMLETELTYEQVHRLYRELGGERPKRTLTARIRLSGKGRTLKGEALDSF